MSVTLIPSAVDPRICAAAQDEAVWRQLLASVYEAQEPYTSSKLSGDPIALVWTNNRLEAVPTTKLPHRDPSIVGYMEVFTAADAKCDNRDVCVDKTLSLWYNEYIAVRRRSPCRRRAKLCPEPRTLRVGRPI
jgi:hypothetical protein